MNNSRYSLPQDPYNSDVATDAEQEPLMEGEQYAGVPAFLQRLLRGGKKATKVTEGRYVEGELPHHGSSYAEEAEHEANQVLTPQQAYDRLRGEEHSGNFGRPPFLPGADGAYLKYPDIYPQMERYQMPYMEGLAQYYNDLPAEQMPLQIAEFPGSMHEKIANMRMEDPAGHLLPGDIAKILQKGRGDATRAGVDAVNAEKRADRMRQDAAWAKATKDN
jgi:hypothetical protein